MKVYQSASDPKDLINEKKCVLEILQKELQSLDSIIDEHLDREKNQSGDRQSVAFLYKGL